MKLIKTGKFRASTLCVLLSFVLVVSLAAPVAWADESDAVVRADAPEVPSDNQTDDGASTADLSDTEDAAKDAGQDSEANTSPSEEQPTDASAPPSENDAESDASDKAADGPDIGSALLEPAAAPTLTYRAHVSNIGWQNWVADKKIAGTYGRALPMEALNIKVNTAGIKGSVEYRAYVEGGGWQDWVQAGELSGSTGQSRQMEAVSIRLTGDLASKYDIYYRTHSADVGWLGWAKSGADAGTLGYRLSLQAIQIQLVEKDAKGPTSSVGALKLRPMALDYRAHVSAVGWQKWYANGSVAGTVGRSLSMEALNIELINAELAGSVEYRAHVQGIGWQGWVSDGKQAGTTGQSRRAEALAIRLTGEMADTYSIYYRVHSAGLGWLGWTKDGALAGSEAFSLGVEAIQIVLVNKENGTPPKETSTLPAYMGIDYQAQANVAGKGWLDKVSGSEVIGTAGQSRKMEAYGMEITEAPFTGGIRYLAHVSNIGWMGYVANGAPAGVIGKGNQVEAVMIQLTGELANHYNVYYRAHSEAYGWMGWTSNGKRAGTSKCGFRLEALQVMILPKVCPAPGSTATAYAEKPPAPPLPAACQAMTNRVQSLGSPTGWLLAVDSNNCWAGVFTGSQWNWKPAYFWRCSPGAPGSPTVRGVYSVTGRGYVFGHGYSCYYYTQFYGDYLFHSVLYYPGTRNIMDGRLGQRLSAGCVRLDINNAKWIYDNIPNRTTVLSY